MLKAIKEKRYMKPFRARVIRFFKENIVVIGLLALYLCFMPAWENLAVRFVIRPFLSKFACNWVTTTVFILLSMFIVYVCGVLIKRKVIVPDWMVGFGLACAGLWAWYRFSSQTAYPLYGISKLCYVDIIVVAVAGCITVWIYQCFCGKSREFEEGEEGGFTIDIPIDSREEDVLGRKDRAENIVQKLMHANVDKAAFTLGIVSKWGNGKSSFMKMMKEYLQEQYGCDLIVIDFNPWVYDKGVNLTHMFFDELRHKLAPLNWKLARRLRYYANTLSGTNTVLKDVTLYSMMLFSEKNIAEQYEDLKARVRQLGKKIVVFVDDVDRLERQEMMEVFQLVRNASNFPNMYFVMGYDKEYVVENLRENLGKHSLSYTDKILQEEYVLPQMTKLQITEHLLNVVKKIATPKDRRAISRLFDDGPQNLDLSQYIRNLREVKRFDNVLSVYYLKLQGEVNLFDFVLFELLRLRYPTIHNLIEDKMDDVFVESEGRMILYRKKKWDAAEESDFIGLFEYMEREQEELHLRSRDILQIKTLLNALWGEHREAERFNINHPQYMARYFYNSLLEKDIPECEMQALLNRPFKEMKPELERLFIQKPIFLKGYFENIPQEKEDIKLRLRIIFYVNSIAKRSVFSDEIIMLMLYRLRDSQYESGYDSDVQDCFVQTLLENGAMAYGLYYLHRLEQNQIAIEQCPLNLAEIRQLKMEVFLRYRDAHDIEEMYPVWKETRMPVQYNQSDKAIPSVEFIYEYNRIMLEVANQNIGKFITLTIQRDDSGRVCYKLERPWPELWGSYERYDTYIAYRLVRQCGKAISNEYRQFMAACYKADWGWIPFDFKEIKV